MHVKEKNRQCEIESIFGIIVLISLAVVSYSVLTYGRTVIHADTAIASMLAKAELKYHQWFPDSWCYANGDLWAFSTNIFTLPFMYLIEDQSLARMLGSLTAILMSVAGIALQGLFFWKDKSWLISIPVFLLCTFGVYDSADPFSGEYDMILYQAANTTTMLWICLVVWLIYAAHGRDAGGFSLKLCTSLMLIALLVSGLRYMAELTMPLIATFVTFTLFDLLREGINRSVITKLLKRILWVLIPSCVGYIINKHIINSRMIFYTGGMGLSLPETTSGYLDNFIQMFRNCFYNFGYVDAGNLFSFKGIRNVISVIMCVFIVFIIPLLQARSIASESMPVKFFFTFGLFHNLEMFLMGVLFSMTTYRYFLSSIYVFEIISAVYVYNHWLKGNGKGLRTATTVIFVFVMFIYWGAMLENSAGWTEALKEKRNLSRELVDRGLTKGYAPYWDSYQHEVYSDGKIEMVSIANDLRQVPGDEPRDLVWQNWGLVDANRFLPEDKDTFLVLDDKLNASFGSRIPLIYGEPVEVFGCAGKTVYVWDYDIASFMANGFADGRLTQVDLWKTENTQIINNNVILNKDGAVYGPFLPLAKGKYRFTVKGSGLEAVRLDVHSYEKPDSVISTEVERNNDFIVIDANISEDINDIEIRVINNENRDVVFEETGIERR